MSNQNIESNSIKNRKQIHSGSGISNPHNNQPGMYSFQKPKTKETSFLRKSTIKISKSKQKSNHHWTIKELSY